MNNLYEAYASNPRYAQGGLEAEIDREEIDLAVKKDAEATTLAKLDEIAPAPEVKSVEGGGSQPDERDSVIKTHEKVLSALDTVTGGSRDITAGMYKAFDNTLAFAVGRDNLDAGNEWFRENLPDISSFTDQFSRGIAPRGTVSAVSQEMTQFMVPFGLYMKGIGAMGAASGVQSGAISQSILADVVTSGTALDPHMERFATLVKSMGIDNQVISWLADNEDETESEGRLKNILDGIGAAGVVAMPLLAAGLTIKGLYRAKGAIKSKPVEAIGKPASEAIKGQTSSMSATQAIPEPTKIPDIPGQFKKHPVLGRKRLNKRMMIEENVMVDGEMVKIERPAGQVLKDIDKRVKSIESALDDL